MTDPASLPPLGDEELAEIESGHMRHSPTCKRLIAALRARDERIKELEGMLRYLNHG